MNTLPSHLRVGSPHLAIQWREFSKRSIDIIVAIILLILFAPLMCVLAILVRRDGAPAFFFHERIGRGGVTFKCIKFRTMRPDAQQVLKELLENDPVAAGEWRRDFKLRNDMRVTPIGRMLRRTSLDELPQLFNVVKGDMSLVGPRPIVAEEIPRYGESIYYYYQCRPGVTGLWQVTGRNDTGYTQRVAFDTQYVRRLSLRGDFVILAKTVVIVLKRHGAY